MNEADFLLLKNLSFSVNFQSHLCKLKSNQNKKMWLIFKSRYKLSAYEITVSELTVNQEGQHTLGAGRTCTEVKNISMIELDHSQAFRASCPLSFCMVSMMTLELYTSATVSPKITKLLFLSHIQQGLCLAL